MEHYQQAPTPEVVFLQTLLQRINSGDIRVPAFQRKFLWRDEQVIKLLNSIYSGYPIGSLLLWRVSTGTVRPEDAGVLPLPEVAESDPTSYVLDGMQRICSIYGSLFPEASKDRDMRICFRLEACEFEFIRDINRIDPKEIFLPLEVIFNPKKFIEFQLNLSKIIDEPGDLINRAIELQSRFQTYQIPMVTIGNRAIREVVEIFQRINSSGTELNSIDFMRAITWSNDFDLNDELQKLQKSIENRHDFKIKFPTLAKIVTIPLGHTHSSGQIYDRLKDATTTQLHDAVGESTRALDRAIELLKERLYIYNPVHLSYEGQLLILMALLLNKKFDSYSDQEKLFKWLWSLGINEELRGKPDHFIYRYISEINLSIEKNTRFPIPMKLSMSVQDFSEKKIHKGRASSSALLSFFAMNSVKSITTGNVIPPEHYLSDFLSIYYGNIFSDELIEIDDDYQGEIGYESASIQRTFSNSLILTEEEYFWTKKNRSQGIIGLINKFDKPNNSQGLESQFIDKLGLKYMAEGQYINFLNHRSKIMLKKIEKHLGLEDDSTQNQHIYDSPVFNYEKISLIDVIPEYMFDQEDNENDY